MKESWPVVVLIKLFCSLYNRYFAGGLASASQVRLTLPVRLTVLLCKLVTSLVFVGR